MNCSMTLRRVVGGVALTGMLACEPAPTASADSSMDDVVAMGRTNDNGASLWFPDGSLPCAVVDGTGALVPVPCTMQVATPSANTNAMVMVRAAGVANPTGQAVHWGPNSPGYQWAGLFYLVFGVTAPPYPCGVKVGPGSTYFVDIVFTTDWQAVVTPSGEATITCHYTEASAWYPW